MSNLALSIKLTTEGGQIVVKELTQIGQTTASTNKELTHTKVAGAAAREGLNQVSTEAKALDGYLSTLRNTVGLLIGGFSAMKMVDIGDDWGQMASRIRMATESAEEYDYVQQRMVASANATYRAITETRESFVSMSPILRDMGYQLSQSIDIVDSYSSLLVTNAASADRASAAQAALSKSIQSNRVDAQSWQTIFGVMPSILNNITAATGKTAQEIRELGISGKLSITDLTNALLLSHQENLAAVEAMPTTVRDAIQSFGNVFSNYIGQLNEAKGVTAGLASGIESLTEHFDILVDIAGGVAAGVVTLYAARTAVSTKATIMDIRAKQAATAQELRLAQAQVAQTRATLAQAAVMARSAGAHGQASAAAAAHTAAVQRLTAAKAAHITVARSMLGVLGGPAGLAITVGITAASLVGFGSSIRSAKSEAEILDEVVKDLTTSYGQLNEALALKRVGENNDRMQDISRQIADITKQIKDTQALANQPSSSGFGGNVAAITHINKLRNKLKELEETYQVLAKANEKVAGMYFDFEGATDPHQERTDALNKALLELYNSQMLNATAVDAYGAALTGIDLELFKAAFQAATELPEDAAAAIRRFVGEATAAQANLSIDTYLDQLRQEIGLLDIKLQKGEAEYTLQKALAQFTGADHERLKALQAELAIMQQKQALAGDSATLTNLQKETELLRVRLAHGKDEYEVQKALYKLKGGDPTVLKAIEAEIRLQQDLNAQIATTEEVASDAWSSMMDDMTALSHAGGEMGDVLVQAFGRVAQQIDAMTGNQIRYTESLKKLAAEKAKIEAMPQGAERAAAEIKHQQTLARLQRENTQAQMGHFASLTGAAKSMLGEQSKGREALHRMEMAFSIAETAMAMQRAAANALTAITNQGNGDPYSAFGRIAAMAAIMAGLGVFSGSVSGNPNIAAERQANQGTGTVLGSDDKSASIANTLDRIEALELDQYNELRSINQSIRQLNQGIAQLAVNLVRSFGRFDAASYGSPLGTDKQFQLGSGLSSFVAGGAIGLGLDKLLLDGLIGNIFNSIIGGISKTTRSLVDSGLSFEAQQLGDIIATGILEGSYYNVIETTKRKLWGLSKRRSQDTEYTALDNALQQEFGRIFGFIGDSVQQAVDLLGIETTRALENFVINLPALSFNEMSGDDIQKELESIFSQQADLMVQYLVPSMAQYQKMGEGLYDTLMRVAQEQAVFNAQLDALGLSLGDLSGALRIDVAQSIIELMGGVEQFRDLTSQFFSAFYSESDQLDYFSRQISQAFSSMGLSVPATREQFKAMVGAIDVTNESGQELFATLMQLVPTLDEYYKALERQADAADKAADAERRLAEQRYGFEMGIWTELSRFDFSPVRKAVDDLQRWYKDSTAEAEQLGADTSLLSTLYNRRLQALAEQTMQQSIDTTRQSMERLVGEFDRGVAQLAATLQQHINAISSMGEQLYAAAQAIRKTVPGFDAVGYYSNQIASLSAGLGTGSITEQLDLVARLRNAIGERYSAELAALDEVSTLEHQHYDVAMDAYRSLIRAAESMRDAAAALSIGDLSPLTTGQRLTEARSQFDVALAAARGGDVDAYTQVQSLGQQILQLSRDFNPANYNSVFADIKSVFEELGGVDGVEPTAPAPHPAIAEYEAQKIALAERTIAELVALQSKTDALTPLAQAEYDAGVAALMAEFAAASDAIIVAFETSIAELYALMPNETDKVVAKLEEQIAAIYGMSSDVTGAIHNQSDIVRNQPPPKMPDVIVPPAPPPKVLVSPPPPVNVDTGSVVRELKEVQKHLEKQREQAERHARQQHERMGVVIDTNRMAYREIVDVHHDYMHGVRQVMR